MKNLPLRSGLLMASALVLAVTASNTARPAFAQRRVVDSIDETRRVTFTGNTRPEANAENDLGQVDDSLPLDHIQLLLRRSDKLQQELDAFTESLSDKN
jgi:hypothetical protein